MNSRIHLFALALLASLPAFSQKFGKDTVIRYFDSNLEPVPLKQSTFVGLAIKDPAGWNAVIYGDSAQIIMRGRYRDADCKIKEGWFAYFYSNGKRAQTGRFIDNRRAENWMAWYSNGKLRDSLFFMNGIQDGPCVSYYENGMPECRGTFKNGTYDGPWEWFYDNGQPATKETYSGGKMSDLQCFDTLGVFQGINCSVSREPEIMGRYGGITKFFRDSLHYPKEAKKKQVEGFVTLTFTVTKKGDVDNIRILYAESPLLADEVLRVLSTVPGWYPAVYHNRKMDFTYQFNIPLFPEASVGDLKNQRGWNDLLELPFGETDYLQ